MVKPLQRETGPTSECMHLVLHLFIQQTYLLGTFPVPDWVPAAEYSLQGKTG